MANDSQGLEDLNFESQQLVILYLLPGVWDLRYVSNGIMSTAMTILVTQVPILNFDEAGDQAPGISLSSSASSFNYSVQIDVRSKKLVAT